VAVSPVGKPKHNKHTIKKNLLIIGLDVHAKTITTAVAPGAGGEARLYGSITHGLHPLEPGEGRWALHTVQRLE